MKSRVPVVALSFLLVTSPLQAQSVFGAGGLGVPIDALDARVRALGGVGPGIFSADLVPGDPTGAAQAGLPTIAVTMQPVWGDFQRDDESGSLQGTRFPVIAVAYPFSTWGFLTVSYGGFLDQRWAAERSGSFALGGEQVDATDRFESNGGISTFRLGWAYQVAERLGIGATLGRHTGSVSRLFSRSFDTLAVGTDVADFVTSAEWGYSAPTASVGVTFDPLAQVRVGASITVSGALEATPREGTEAAGASFELPTEFRVGVSAALTSRLMVTSALALADWSAVAPELGIEGTGQTSTFGVGAEWGGPRLGGRSLPVRLGYRRAELPFSFADGSPVESAVSLGLGLNLAQVEEFPLARVDFAIERGNRDEGALSESFWRVTTTLRVSGR